MPKEIKKTIPDTVAPKTIKCLQINVVKEVKDLYCGNYQTLMKDVKEDTDKWKDIQCPWVGTLNIIKMSTLAKVNYRCNAVPVRRGNAVKIILFYLDHHRTVSVRDNDVVGRVKTDNAREIQVSGRMS